MAFAREMTSHAGLLVSAVSGLDEKRDPKSFAIARDLVLKKLKSHGFPQTDYFGVKRTYQGLEEKFSVLGRDDLSDALRERVAELSGMSSKWTPDILSLFLHLADNPVHKTDIRKLESHHRDVSPPPTTWKQILEDDPLDETGIWENIDYSADSEDGSLIEDNSALVLPTNDGSTDLTDEHASLAIAQRTDETAKGVAQLAKSQFWIRRQPILEFVNAAEQDDQSFVELSNISEIQAVRESLLMIRGLPTSLYIVEESSGRIVPDEEYAIFHARADTFRNVLLELSDIGNSIRELRHWKDRPQESPLLRIFQSGIEKRLLEFNSAITNIETTVIDSPSGSIVSVIRVREQVRDASRLVLTLYDVIDGAKEALLLDAPKFILLEALFEKVCQHQYSADDEAFSYLAQLFFDCLAVYLRPVRRWVRSGELESSEGSTFFIKRSKNKRVDLSTLWHDQFDFRMSSDGNLLAPRFLWPAASKILNAGKSFIFLSHLDFKNALHEIKSTFPTFESICDETSGTLLAPFQELLEQALLGWVDVERHANSAGLCRALFMQCDLPKHLDALEVLYLFKDGSLASQFALNIFNKIDRRKESWNDRFILTELAQSIFSSHPVIIDERISVRSNPGPYGDIQSKKRTVKTLSRMTIEYKLSWPVLNIIPLQSLRVYQRISTLLLQLLRAKFILERLRLLRVAQEFGREECSEGLYLILRQRFLWLISILYSHFTEFVIATSALKIRLQLTRANDVDELIKTHKGWMNMLESQCLLTQQLQPLHQCLVSILDLAIFFADLHTSQMGERSFDVTNRSFSLQASQMFPSVYRKKRRLVYTDGTEEEDSSDESDFEVDLDHISLTGNSYCDRLKIIREQLRQLTHFLSKGLRGVSRASGESSWDTLAEKLEWGLESDEG